MSRLSVFTSRAALAALLILARSAHAQNPEAEIRAKLAAAREPPAAAPANPAVEQTHPNSGDMPELIGFTHTTGGNDGRVIHVTTLNAFGQGSLGDAVAAEGPRRIMFDVAGVIDLRNPKPDPAKPNESGLRLNFNNPFITVDGETAPSPGITLIRGAIYIATHDVIIRHLRVRPGENDQPKKIGWESDGLASGTGAYDVLIEHCSCEWATDENLSASGERFMGETVEDWRRSTSHNITFRYNIAAEGLSHATHRKDEHSKGSLIHDNVTNMAILGNLYASNMERNPLFKGGARGVVADNLIVNPGNKAVHFGLVPAEWGNRPWVEGQMAIVNNVMHLGPSSKPTIALMTYARGPLSLYMDGNVATKADGSPAAMFAGALESDDRSAKMQAAETGAAPAKSGTAEDASVKGCRRVEKAPLWPEDLKAWPADKIEAWILANAGARPWERDAVDKRVVEQARTNTGKIIDSQNDVEGYASVPPSQ